MTTRRSVRKGAVCAASSHTVQRYLGIARWARLADLGISVTLGVAVFYAGARAARVTELDAAWSAIGRPLARRLGLGR